MKTIFTLLFILISLIGYSQDQTQNYVKKDPLTLGIETTTITLKTRDEIENKIEEYNRRLEGLFMEREEWVKLLNQCDKLQIISTQDTIENKSMMGIDLDDNMKLKGKSKSSSTLGTGILNITNTGKTTTNLKPIIKKKTKKVQK